MQAWVEKLVALQEIDLRIAKLQVQLTDVPKLRAEAELQYKSEAAALLAAQDEQKQAEVLMRGFEGEIASIQAKKRDFQSKSAMIKNNNEYRAAMLQIEMCDKAISDVEEKQIEAMLKIDQIREQVAEKKKDLEAGKARAQVVLDDLETRRANCERLMKQLEDKRPAAEEAVKQVIAEAQALDATVPDYLAAYNRLRASRVNPKTQACAVPLDDGACGRCHMKATAQLRNEVTKGKLVFCSSCGAILYLE